MGEDQQHQRIDRFLVIQEQVERFVVLLLQEDDGCLFAKESVRGERGLFLHGERGDGREPGLGGFI